MQCGRTRDISLLFHGRFCLGFDCNVNDRSLSAKTACQESREGRTSTGTMNLQSERVNDSMAIPSPSPCKISAKHKTLVCADRDPRSILFDCNSPESKRIDLGSRSAQTSVLCFAENT